MGRKKSGFVGFFLIILCFALSGLLVACGSDASPTTQPQPAAAPTSKVRATLTPAPPLTATPNGPTSTIRPDATLPPTPYITPLPQESQPKITAGPPRGQTTGCTFSAEYALPHLREQIKNSQDIVQTQVTNIGELAWSTADGKAPAQECDLGYFQYSPVEITVKESYKGQLAPGAKLVLWLSGAPASLMQGNYDYFPKVGEHIIFFLGEEENLRRDTTENPMTTRTVWEIYRLQSPGSDKWVSQLTMTPFTIEWLKAVIKDPAIEPTPTPFPPPPTPYARAGQTLQLTTLYKLDKAVRVYIKAPDLNPPLVGDEKPGSDRFNRLVKAFDRPLKVITNLDTYPDAKAETTTIPFGFELPDQTYVSFVFFPGSNSLVHQLTDDHNFVELEVPADLKAIFGL